MTAIPKITIALATYNGAKYLPYLLNSINKQTVLPAKLVVVDDCSTDGTLQVLSNFIPNNFEIVLHQNQQNLGVNQTFKKLANICTGDNYVAFCDQDDIWLPEKLALSLQQLGQIDDRTIPCVSFSNLQIMAADGSPSDQTFWQLYNIKPDKTTFFLILSGNNITGCTALINQAMLKEITQMPEGVILYDHWMALIAFGFGKYTFVSTPLVLYRFHTSSVTTKEKKGLAARIYNQIASSYLKAEIEQAKLFFTQYVNRLSPQMCKQINRFISIEKTPYLLKKVLIIYRRKKAYRNKL